MTDPTDTVDAQFRTRFGRAPDWRFRVPGRLEVFGKHTDYAGGRSLVAAVPPGFAVAAGDANDGLVEIVDAMSGARFSCRIGERVSRDPSGWHRYASTVINRLSANFPSADLSARIVLGSNLPSSAGISSSSALIVSIAEVLIACGRIEDTPAWQDAIHGPEDRASYFGCIENGASFGSLPGDEGVGTHGGSEDHAAIVMSRAGTLQQFAFSPLRRERSVLMPGGWTFVVQSSGVRATKTGNAREDYNRLAAEAAAIRRAWQDRYPDDPRSLAELARAGVLAELSLAPRLLQRLAHLRGEDARVADAADAFERGDLERIRLLAGESQREAEQRLQNQVPETSDLVALALEAGATAASVFGAGWGGSAWALVPADSADHFRREWSAAYSVRHPGLQSVAFVCPPSAGLERLPEIT